MKLYANRNYWLSTLGWCLRTCLSVGIITFLCIYSKSQYVFSFHGQHLNGLAFGMFVTVVVKDSTLGASIINGWAVVFGSLVASIVCWIMLMLMEASGGYSVSAALGVMFILSFILQYFEFHPLGKKVALSLVAVNMLQDARKSEQNPIEVWEYLSDMLFGTACALIGNIIPWRRTACDEINETAQFNAVSMGSLLEDIVGDWCNFGNSINNKRKSDFDFSSKQSGVNENDIPTTQNSIKSSRKLTNNNYSKYIRQELYLLLQKNLSDMQLMTIEEKLGPKRAHTELYVRYAELTRRFLLIINILEQRLQKMKKLPDNAMNNLVSFLQFPEFQSSLTNVMNKLTVALYETSQLLKQDLYKLAKMKRRHSIEPKIIQSLSDLKKAINAFDEVYKNARKTIYYTPSDPLQPSSNMMEIPLLLHMNGFLFLIDAACKLVLKFDPIISAQLVHYDEQHAMSRLKRFSVLLQHYVNYFRRLQADIIPPQKHLFKLFVNPPPPSTRTASDPTATNPTRRSDEDCCYEAMSLSKRLSPVVLRRLRQCLSVSISMLIAGIYGYYADTLDPSFAAFTVSYISGGAVAGASIVTSFNRCVGSVVACVLALLVIDMVGYWSVERAHVFIGFVIVLSQIPATYIRAQRLYGYAGVCFGFTVPILLVTYPQIQESGAVQRIIDTIVAVFIFVTAEICLLQVETSEDILLITTNKIFHDIRNQFKVFMSVFTSTQIGKKDKMSSLRTLQTQTFVSDIKLQRDLTTFVSFEPSLWRPSYFPEKLLEELLSLEEQAHRSIEVLSWAVIASHEFSQEANSLMRRASSAEDLPQQRRRRLTVIEDRRRNSQVEVVEFVNLLLPLEEFMEDIELVVYRTSKLLETGIHRLGYRHYVKCCSCLSHLLDNNDRANTEQNDYVLYKLSAEGYDLSEVMDILSSIVSNVESTATTATETVERNLFSKLAQLISNWQHIEKTPLDIIQQDTLNVLHDERKVGRNQMGDNNEDCETQEMTSSPVTRMVAGNEEVKIVNAALVSLTDLLGALGGIASVIMKLQAHRAVQTSDDKYFAELEK